MRQTALNTVYELAKQDSRVFFVGSDLGQGVLEKFKQEMPERFFMEGVSEALVVGMSAGLAMEGKIVYANTIATFFSRRAYEQVVLDLCLQNLPVRLICNGGGLVYAPLGPTHLAIEDIAILRTIPNLTILAPCDAEEMRTLVRQSLDYPGPMYIRVAKGGETVVSTQAAPATIGKGVIHKSGKDVLLISTGVTLQLALDAHQQLANSNISATVLHMPTIKPFDTALLTEQVKPVRAIVTIEEGVVTGGLGSAVAEVLLESGISANKKFRRIGIPDKFPDQYGSQASLMEHCGISSSNVVTAAEQLLM